MGALAYTYLFTLNLLSLLRRLSRIVRPQNAGSGLSVTTYEAFSWLFPCRVVALGDGSELKSGLLTVQQTLTSTMLGACDGALGVMALSYLLPSTSLT